MSTTEERLAHYESTIRAAYDSGSLGGLATQMTALADEEQKPLLDQIETLKAAINELAQRRGDEEPADSVVEAFQMIEADWRAEHERAKFLRAQIETLADWHDTKAYKAKTYPGEGQEKAGLRVAATHTGAAYRLREILKDTEEA